MPVVGVELRGDRGLEVVQAEIRREFLADVVLDILGDGFLERQHLARRRLLGVAAGRQQRAVGVEHGDLVERHPGHRGGDEVADRLAGARIGDRVRPDQHGRGRRLPRPAERALVGQHDVDARGADAVHQLDRPRELALRGAHAGDVLHERREAERAELVVEFVAGAGAVRQALLGEKHAGTRRLVVAHLDAGTVRADVERDAHLVESRTDIRDVLPVEAGVEDLEGRPAEIHAADADDRGHREPDRAERDEAPPAELGETREKGL